ncbi:helix-turn-helix transcriptional regulator [Flavobacterium sp. SUN052]|uniref:helix-turn-helix domain-containing protein n=1 Tax=Flavobacterium sp. SUN052 TaxID=3002441 RepID=UPI00237E259A|nr:helix-turn-helix transcriptional regulator [Flavobacterium sp. SUN052]MEC4004196.1 helix-turn-helix transcriptional regulator [Flavobacterium sp. SUN052]
MLFQFGFYSSLLLITFSQGIIYTVLLFIKGLKTENKSNYWLSFFIFLCSLFIAPWMLGFAGWYDNQPYRDILFYTPFQHLLFIGPVIFCYTQSLLNPGFKFNKKQFLHFLPGIIYLIYSISMWVYDKFIFGDYYFYKDGMDKDFDFWYQKLGLISMLIYFVLSLRYYNIYKKIIVQVVSYADSILFKWIKTYLIAFLIMLLLPIIFDCISYLYPKLNSYTGSWWFFLFFSFIMYYIAITGYSNPINSSIPFKFSKSNTNKVLLLSENNNFTEEDSIIDIEYETFTENSSTEIDLWKNKIETLIQEESLFNNPELTLSDLAKKLNTNVSIISKTINQGFQMNFNDFINNYRIEEVKKAFDKGEHKKTTLLGIAFDCGFNSKATFNRAFKKNTGFSPKEYLEKA